MEVQHMVTFPQTTERSKYTMIIEHLENDLRLLGVTKKELKVIYEEALDPALNPSRSLIAYLRSEYKARRK